ncbi:MAG: DUF4139 domain-containing protein [Kiritimatiellia bacterium]
MNRHAYTTARQHCTVRPAIAACLMFMLLALTSLSSAQNRVDTSPPQGVTLSLYDVGLGLVNEARRVTLGPGENTMIIRDLPVQADPASLSFSTVTPAAPFELLAQRFQYDLGSTRDLLRRMTGQSITMAGNDEAMREGVLMGGPIEGESGPVLPVRSSEGNAWRMLGMDDIGSVTFPYEEELFASEPRALWTVRARREGPQNFRLTYRVDGLSWRAFYELVLTGERMEAALDSRMEIVNHSGGSFENARVRLLTTERGQSDPIVNREGYLPENRPAMRFAYGAGQPSFERTVAALAPSETYELPRTVDLPRDATVYIPYLQADTTPVRRFYVYDGVRFDRFQRNIRTDWNYGTEYHTQVELHLEFTNEEKFGLGKDLPPGWCRVYERRADGIVDLIGEEPLLAIPAGGTGTVRVGPAIGLLGERERTRYEEIRPHHVYEESFQIRLSNDTEERTEIRVVEHLYRWSEFEITRTDTEFSLLSPSTIGFRVELEPGARKDVNYTVRYSW